MDQMTTNEIHVVTGAYEYSGSYMARRLLDAGHTVRTLSPVPPHGELAGKVEPFPLAFDEANFAKVFAGAKVLYNTYWIRYDGVGATTQAQAVENTKAMFAAARRAGVERVVHVSITNPSPDSPYAYFRHKYTMEQALIGSGLSYAILRPATLFGGRDILINNIAWTLRHLPFIGLFGKGEYHLRPIHVEDLARLAIEQGASRENLLIDATGPEDFAYRDLYRELAKILGVHRPIIPMAPRAAFALVCLFGKFVHDRILTWPEVGALMDGLLSTDAPSAGTIKLTDWARANADNLGRTYANEMARRRHAVPEQR